MVETADRAQGPTGQGRVIVIGLDGTPHSFIQREVVNGDLMPNFKKLLAEGSIVRMNSTHPDVSSVAWASFMTGTNPAKHGIFGFSDRKPGTYETYIPTARHLQRETLWDLLSGLGKRVCAMGVPMSYPPHPINGILIGCFLSPSIEKAVFPPSLVPELVEIGYRVDTDALAARKSRKNFLTDYQETLERRANAALRLLSRERWDLFMVHVIETDRLHHFLWGEYASQNPEYYPAFLDCYRQVDDFLGKVSAELTEYDELVILSDHGSCAIQQEFYLNRWLVDMGYLQFKKTPPEGLADIDPTSRAYCLDPGRIYVNLRGREPEGSVGPGEAYEELCRELVERLSSVVDPGTGSPMVARVHRKEDIYSGALFERAPDLVVQTNEGFDVKGSLSSPSLVGRSELTGMHTFDDAMLYVRGDHKLATDRSIVDATATVLELLNIPGADDLDGRSCLL